MTICVVVRAGMYKVLRLKIVKIYYKKAKNKKFVMI